MRRRLCARSLWSGSTAVGHKAWRRRFRGVLFEEGQSTVEYLVVALAVITVVATLSLLVRAGENGVLVRLGANSASHAVGGRNPGDALLDIFMF